MVVSYTALLPYRISDVCSLMFDLQREINVWDALSNCAHAKNVNI